MQFASAMQTLTAVLSCHRSILWYIQKNHTRQRAKLMRVAVLTACSLLMLLAGCAQQGPGPVQAHVVSMHPQVLAQIEDARSERSYGRTELKQTGGDRNGLDPVSEAVVQMAHQLETGMDKSNISRLPLAVLAFRNLLQPGQVGELGERLGDSFVFQLEQRGYNLVDYRAQSLVTSVKPDIEPYNMSALRTRHRIYFVLTGTYALHPDGVVINARLLDTTTRQVLASGQSHIPLSRLEQRWPGYDLLEARERGMIIENRQGPAGGSQ